MVFLNVEIKARTNNPALIKEYLQKNGALFKGTDFQVDTYFKVQKGRLKVREGNIETNLIYYERSNVPGPKSSSFHLVKITDTEGLKKMLTSLLGIMLVVKKEREIYYIGNVKFHIDKVADLGSFIEIEAGNILAALSEEQLKEQCEFHLNHMNIKQEDLIAESYSDMLLK